MFTIYLMQFAFNFSQRYENFSWRPFYEEFYDGYFFQVEKQTNFYYKSLFAFLPDNSYICNISFSKTFFHQWSPFLRKIQKLIVGVTENSVDQKVGGGRVNMLLLMSFFTFLFFSSIPNCPPKFLQTPLTHSLLVHHTEQL